MDPSDAAPRSHRRALKNWAFPLVTAAFLLSLAYDSPTLLNLSSYLPTQDEREIADAYDVPVHKIRSAQALADMHSISQWHRREKKLKKFLHKIDEKHGAKDYMNVPDGCEATVMIIRHCEKGDVREHCAYVGYERSVYLATQFGEDGERWPSPSYIFAMSPPGQHNKHKMNFREIETVGPLAKKSGVTIDTSYTSHTKNSLTRQILTFLQTGQMCGKLTVVSWKHSEIGSLAHHLGCGPSQGCPVDYKGKNFDTVWQVKFAHRTFDHSTHKSLKLPKEAEWRVFGSVQNEGFDPLAVSNAFGDYPRGGTSWSARWMKADTSIPERHQGSSGGWKATSVGFQPTND
jgi:hypothetical protein